MRGHYWTLRPFLTHLLQPEAPPPSRHFRTSLVDPTVGPVRLTGRLQTGSGSRDLVIVVHGLGGSHASSYGVAMALACERAGIDCLRISLRGADRRGDDIYHAGLTVDLRAVCASDNLAGYQRLRIVGYSMGGHVSLKYLTESHDPRVAALATVCTPLDLEAGAAAIDRWYRTFYRRHVLNGLQDIYAAAADRGVPLPLAKEEVWRIDTISDWDERVVAPRFGFASARDYWRRESVHSRLGELSVPTLAVVTRHDPMVPIDLVLPHLEGHPHIETVVLGEGGHVGFPPDVDLGLRRGPGGAGFADQVLSWLRTA